MLYVPARLTLVCGIVLFILCSSYASGATGPDIGLTVIDSPDPVNVGEKLVYTSTITNYGPGEATQVRWGESRGSGENFSIETSQGICSLAVSINRYRCNLGSLAPGASAQVKLVVIARLRRGGDTNRARFGVSYPYADQDLYDPNPANNNVDVITHIRGGVQPAGGCPDPTFPRPQQPISIRAHMWRFTAEVSDDDGLVLRDVSLGTRRMAKEMGLPYLVLGQRSFVGTDYKSHGELKPDGEVLFWKTRLVDLKQEISSTMFAIEAVYAIEHRDPVSNELDATCVKVAQRYEFYNPQWPTMHIVSPFVPCEPSEEAPVRLRAAIPCTRFRPSVRYEIVSSRQDPFISQFTAAQRFHFTVDNVFTNTAAVFRDYDALSGLVNYDILKDENPLLREVIGLAVNRGNAGEWDNFHQTYNRYVDEPAPPPGCPECVHIHWRWGAFLNFPDGRPLIPQESDQDAWFGIVAWQPGEEDPPDTWRRYADDGSLIGMSQVFWYEGTGYGETDTFFNHFGFFIPAVSLEMNAIRYRPGLFHITIRNTSKDDIAGPVSLVFDNLNTTLPLIHGHTQAELPAGSPYINFYLGKDNALKPKQKAEFTIQFSTPTPSFRPRIITGPDPR